MIHYEQDINQSKGHTILECLDRLDGNLVHPSLVPVRENTRLQTNIVDFKSLLEYTNTSGYSTFTEAVNDIKNYNHIQNLTVSIDEAYIYDMPEIVNLFESYVIKPVSKNSIEYQLCEKYLTPYLETGDESLLEKYNNITDTTLGNLVLNEFIDPSTGESLTSKQVMDRYGSLDAYKQQHQMYKDTKGAGNRSYSNISNFNTANRSEQNLQTVKNTQMTNLHAQMNEKAKRTAAIARSVNGQSGNHSNMIGDAISSIAGASGNSQGPSWWARNFAAFKNWMNNTFGTKFNTRVGSFNTYKDYLAKAGNVATNFAGTQTGQNLINQGTDKLKGLAGKYGGKYANQLKDGIDMVRDVVGGVFQPSNAATEITAGQILSEVYRPRRMYRSTYMRMH